jgi:hypothetical protein
MKGAKSESRLTVVIVQPCFFPWRGQFDLFSRAEVKIFLDDVQFSRGSWYNRNKIMTESGPTWITVPVRQKGSMQTRIKDMPISQTEDWHGKILGQIYSAYRKSPFFKRYYESLAELIGRKWDCISDLSRASVKWGFEQLDRPAEFLTSSEMGVEPQNRVERLVNFCTAVGANRYLSGPSARDYIGEGDAFKDAGIELVWMEYPSYPPYRDDDGEEMSIIDLLFRKGPEAPRYIWKEP